MIDNSDTSDQIDKRQAEIRHAYNRLLAAVGKLSANRISHSILASKGGGAPKFKELAPDKMEPVRNELQAALPLELSKTFPVFPLQPERKDPMPGSHAHVDATQNPKIIRNWAKKFPNCNWGIVGNFVDVDARNNGIETWKALTAEHGEPDTWQSSTPSGGSHFAVIERIERGKALGSGVDVPNYVVAPGSHVTVDGKSIRATGFYEIVKYQAPISMPWVATLTGLRKDKVVRQQVELEPVIEPEQAAKMLKLLDPAAYREEEKWRALGMSYYYTTGGQGFADFYEWSLGDTEYNGDTSNIETRWDSWGDRPPEKSIREDAFYEAVQESGKIGAEIVRSLIADQVRAEFGADPVNDFELAHTDNEVPEVKVVFPKALTAQEMEDTEFPDLKWQVKPAILKGWPNTLDGDGGVGKSLLGTQFAVSVASGIGIFGFDVEQAPVLYITHEDIYKVIKQRMMAQAKYLDQKFGKLPIQSLCVPELDIALAEIDETGRIKYLPFFRELERYLKETRGMFVVLDCHGDLVRMQGNLVEPANAYYKNVLQRLCMEFDATVLELCHPSKMAMATGQMYAGGTSNKTAVRNKLQMTLSDPKDLFGPRKFGPLKANYSGGFKPVELVYSIEHGIFLPRNSEEQTRADYEKQQVVVAKVHELIRQGLTVVKNQQANGQGPKDLHAALLKDGHEDISEREIKMLLGAAERDGQLRYHGNTPGRHGKAHYEIPEDSRAPETPTNEFMELIEGDGGDDA